VRAAIAAGVLDAAGLVVSLVNLGLATSYAFLEDVLA
jgi:hypothetical protein